MFKDKSPFGYLELESFKSNKVFKAPQSPHVLVRPNEYLGSTPEVVVEEIKKHKLLLAEFESYGIRLPKFQHILGHKYQYPESKKMYASHVLVERIDGVNLDKLTQVEARNHKEQIEDFLGNLIQYHKDKFGTKEKMLVDIKGLYQFRLGRSSLSQKQGIFLVDIENISADVWQSFTQLSGYNELLSTIRETEWLVQNPLPVMREKLAHGVLQMKSLVPNRVEQNYKKELLEQINTVV